MYLLTSISYFSLWQSLFLLISLSSLFFSLPPLPSPSLSTPCHSHSIFPSGTPILLSQGDPGVTVVETHNLTLTCLVAVERDALHSPHLVWYRNDAKVVEDGHNVTFERTFLGNQVTETEDRKNMHKFTVSLVNVARHQAGMYECRLFHRRNMSHSRAVFDVAVHCERLVCTLLPQV